MRIVHIGKYYPPDRGGMESFLQTLARAQVEHGHSVTVLAHTDELCTKSRTESNKEIKTKAGIITDCGVKVRRCKIAFRVGSYAPVAPALALHTLRHLFLDSDIIHAHSPNVASLYSLFALRRPVILQWHSDVIFPEKSQNMHSPHLPTKRVPDWMIAGWRVLEKLCLNKAACIVVSSQAYLDSSEFLRPYLHKCRVVPLALGMAPEPDYNSPAVDFLQKKGFFPVLAVGRLSHYKGFDILIKALASLPNARLCLVGQGECEDALRLLVQECGLNDRVFFAGDISEGMLRACYQTCQCFVLPSILRTEAFGLVLLEAMREAKACVASNVIGSGMGTIVCQGKTGLLYSAGDVLALAKALQTVSADENLCRRMGQAGYERWKSVYNIDSIYATINDIYRKFLGVAVP